MEIVVKVIFINLDEMGFSLNRILGRFPDDLAEMFGIVDCRCAQQALAERVIKRYFIADAIAHQHIVVIAGKY